MRNNFILSSTLGASFVMLALTSLVLNAQESTPEPIIPTPTIISIFEGDTCTAPCWYGITPGVSTSKDVRELFDSNPSKFIWDCVYECEYDSENKLVNGMYEFYWRQYDRFDIPILPGWPPITQIESDIAFDGDSVRYISVYARKPVSLLLVLEIFGKPDVAYLFCGSFDDFRDACFLSLSYADKLITVYLHTNLETCVATSVLNDYVIDRFVYFSPYFARTVPEYGTEARIFYTARGRQIRGDDWERFINGEGYETCNDFLESLPTDVILPPLPSFLSTPEATSTR